MLFVSTVNLPPSLSSYVVAGAHCESCNVCVPPPKKMAPKFGRGQKHLMFTSLTTI